MGGEGRALSGLFGCIRPGQLRVRRREQRGSSRRNPNPLRNIGEHFEKARNQIKIIEKWAKKKEKFEK